MLALMNIKNSDLYKKVHAFRKAWKKIPKNDLNFELFEYYPTNCCEFCSYLLGKYLGDECGYSSPLLLQGKNRYKHRQRHAWLRIGVVDVDITAYQFSSTKRRIIVEPYSIWHMRFDIDRVEKLDTSFDIFCDEAKEQLLSDYQHVISIIA